MSALRIVGKAARAFYEELYFYLILGLGHVVAWLLIVPGPFALAGVYAIGQRSVRGLGTSWGTIGRGIREYGPRSLLLFIITAAGYATVLSNLWFYNTPGISSLPTWVAMATTPLFVAIGLAWTGVTFYAQSFLMELEVPRLRLVFRNSLYLVMLRPLQTLFFVVVSLAALLLSIALPFLLVLWPGFVSALALTAVRTLVGELSVTQQSLPKNSEEGTRTSD